MRSGKGFPERTRSVLAVVVLLTALFPGVSVAQGDSAAAGAGANAMLQPGDLVRLKIWREPDLSGDNRVDENGVATFPKIGPLPVSHLTTDSLKSLLVSSYDRYLVNPSVEVTVLRRVNVLGAVKNPGLYDADPTMTIADVVAMAGGVSDEGNRNRVELIRQGERLPVELSQQSRLAGSPVRSGDQLRVPERSWLSRNTAVVGAGITAAALIIVGVTK